MQTNFDYSKLREYICEKFGSEEEFARSAGILSADLTAKLNNAADFSLPEMDAVCALLGIGDDEIAAFFFEEK